VPRSQIEATPGYSTGVVARQTGSANLRPRGVDGARRRHADLSHQGCATIAFAPHAPALVIDKRAWDPIELGVGLDREPRPFQ